MSQDKKKLLFYYREFLNKPGWHSLAAINLKIMQTDYDYGEKRRGSRFGIEASISDCYEQINLDLSASSEESLDNSIYKIDVLVEGLTKLKAELKKTHKLIQKEKKRQEKQGKVVDDEDLQS